MVLSVRSAFIFIYGRPVGKNLALCHQKLNSSNALFEVIFFKTDDIISASRDKQEHKTSLIMTIPNSSSHPEHYNRRYAIILAGGSGTRLWPLSRSAKPKQLLALNGKESLLQETARRILPLVHPQHILTVVHADYRFEVAGQLHAIAPQLADNILVEPLGRNTLPAIAWATAEILKRDPEAIVAVFSSDHAVANDSLFQEAWLSAEQAAQNGYLTLFGMQPNAPATGYGYIQAKKEPLIRESDKLPPVFPVKRFVEKPDRETAEAYLKEGSYYWNAGIFVFQANQFMAQLQNYQPSIYGIIQQLAENDKKIANKTTYQQLPDLSIDYGLLELADKVAVVPAEIGWSDLGSWEAIYQQHDKDDQGNMLRGEIISEDSQNNLLWSEHGVVAALGVSNLAVVQTRDATLVCTRDRVEDIKKVVTSIKCKYPNLAEVHTTVTRPWGNYTVLEEGLYFKVKRIMVNPGAKLSMQMHYHRSEHWVVIAGTAKVTVGDSEVYLEANQSTYISKTQRHRLENPGKIPVEIIEIQSGAYLEEDDIVRFDDVYGRIQ